MSALRPFLIRTAGLMDTTRGHDLVAYWPFERDRSMDVDDGGSSTRENSPTRLKDYMLPPSKCCRVRNGRVRKPTWKVQDAESWENILKKARQSSRGKRKTPRRSQRMKNTGMFQLAKYIGTN